jgi:predicted nucleotidyltransferase
MREHGIGEEQIQTLRDLVSCWGSDVFVLIGARALGCFLPLTWRRTEDLDVTVTMTLEEYPAGLDDLPGWRQDSVITQRWYSSSGVRVDVIPAGRDGRSVDPLQWPGEDRVLSRVGLRLAIDFSTEVRFDEGFSVKVASVPAICVLKMIAYLDRPEERRRDLLDIAHLLIDYPDVTRRFELDEVFEHGLDYDQAGPFALGREIQAMDLSPSEREAVDQFLARLETGEEVATRMAREVGSGAGADHILRLVRALRLGLRRSEA